MRMPKLTKDEYDECLANIDAIAETLVNAGHDETQVDAMSEDELIATYDRVMQGGIHAALDAVAAGTWNW